MDLWVDARAVRGPRTQDLVGGAQRLCRRYDSVPSQLIDSRCPDDEIQDSEMDAMMAVN